MILRRYQEQREFIESEKQNLLFLGGRGAGKTYAGALWAFRMMVQYPDIPIPGIITANTYDQLQKYTLNTLLQILTEAEVPFVYGVAPPAGWPETRFKANKHNNVLSLANGAQAQCASLEKYPFLRGGNSSFWWGDESRDYNPEVIPVIQGRFRGMPQGWVYYTRLTSTPKGHDHQYYRFMAEGDEDEEMPRLPDSAWIRASTEKNIYEPDLAERLRASYGKRYATQEISAEIINIKQGRVYDFDRHRHTADLKYAGEPVIFSMDFNIDPAVALVMSIDVGRRTVRVWDEIVLRGGKHTWDVCREFKRRWGKRLPVFKNGPRTFRRITIDGDPSCRQRGANAPRTNLDIILNEFKDEFVIDNAFKNKAKTQLDYANFCNALFDSDGAILIDKTCKNLIRDLEEVVWDDKGKIDKSDDRLTHFTDAFKYPVGHRLPFKDYKQQMSVVGVEQFDACRLY